jgi:ribosome-associated heat shock protein Hsp15
MATDRAQHSERRGSAEVAQQLYTETDESRAAREKFALERRSMPTAFAYGDGKPGKHERRALRRFKGD